MATQLVRLDKPYKLICGKNKKFGMQIATLMMIKGEELHCYPVVDNRLTPGGEVWKDCELEDCMVVCGKEETVLLENIYDTVKFFYDTEADMTWIPWKLSNAITENGLSFLEYQQHDFQIELIFDEGGNEDVCMVDAASSSKLFFPSTFIKKNDAMDEFLAIKELAEMRDAYRYAFAYFGIYVTFYTRDEKYKDFVDKLNNYKRDE